MVIDTRKQLHHETAQHAFGGVSKRVTESRALRYRAALRVPMRDALIRPCLPDAAFARGPSHSGAYRLQTRHRRPHEVGRQRLCLPEHQSQRLVSRRNGSAAVARLAAQAQYDSRNHEVCNHDGAHGATAGAGRGCRLAVLCAIVLCHGSRHAG